MKAFDFYSLGWNDLAANGIFFLLEIILLSILVPILIRRQDKRKWAAARNKVGQRSAHHLERINSAFDALFIGIRDFAAIFPDAFGDNPEAHTKEGIEKQRGVLFHRLGESIERLEKTLAESVNEYLQEVQILTPSFDSEIAIRVVEFYEASIRPRSLAMAKLYWWLMSGKNKPGDIGVNPTLQELYVESRTKLFALCASVRHTPELPAPDLAQSMQALAIVLKGELAKVDPSIPDNEPPSPGKNAGPRKGKGISLESQQKTSDS